MICDGGLQCIKLYTICVQRRKESNRRLLEGLEDLEDLESHKGRHSQASHSAILSICLDAARNMSEI